MAIRPIQGYTAGMSDTRRQDLLNTASRLRQEGRIPEAIDAYRTLLQDYPDLPDSWYNLAWLLRQARQGPADRRLPAMRGICRLISIWGACMRIWVGATRPGAPMSRHWSCVRAHLSHCRVSPGSWTPRLQIPH